MVGFVLGGYGLGCGGCCCGQYECEYVGVFYG